MCSSDIANSSCETHDGNSADLTLYRNSPTRGAAATRRLLGWHGPASHHGRAEAVTSATTSGTHDRSIGAVTHDRMPVISLLISGRDDRPLVSVPTARPDFPNISGRADAEPTVSRHHKPDKVPIAHDRHLGSGHPPPK